VAVVVHAETLFAVGGWGGQSQARSTSVEIYDFFHGAWSLVPDLLSVGRAWVGPSAFIVFLPFLLIL
jgi:hypothetical protein